MSYRTSFAVGASLLALLMLSSCGGGGGGGEQVVEPASCSNPGNDFSGVCSGFTVTATSLDWQAGGDGSGGVGDGGASGDGGVGAGGDFGQFRNATVSVFKDDGTLVGTALTDNTGMVTIRPGRSYRGGLRVEFRGGPGATYFEEGKNTFVPFPADRVVRVIVPRIDKNIGATPFTEAAYRMLTEGSTPERATGTPTATQIRAANERVRNILNDQFPEALHVDDITRLPFIKSDLVGAGSISPVTATNARYDRGRYGLVNGAFSKQAALFNTGRSAPTLDAVAQLSTDLLDGQLDGRNGNAPAAAVGERTYDPNTLTGELSSALAEQAERFGNTAAFNALPKVLNFGNTRYEGYLFDGTVTRERKAFSTVAGWVSTTDPVPRALGSSNAKFADTERVFGMFANFGHGGALFKTDTIDSRGKIYALGDNVNGELGVGTTTPTRGGVVELTLPGVLTHAAGGFAHTVVRLADGSVYAWGDNSFGQLGQGVDAFTLPRSTTPVRVNLPSGAVAVAATSVASYALMADGTVYSWGSNGGFGLLGNGQRNGLVTTPALVAGLTDVVQISARDNDAVVLRRDNTLWQWGSFPATPFVGGANTGGNLAPVQLMGLPAGVPVRKLLTEQGLVAVLLGNGQVWTWGVYFDLTANEVLRDLTATRVLGLPKLRDIMPGGFNGYGSRPFDRNTAMGIDYAGGMWKIRGRVAEQFDPANPAQQRRPQGQTPRPDCASCHLFLTDWPLTPAAPTSAVVCTPPADQHGSGANSLIHAETQCEQCHNPNRTPAIAAFPNGWLACVRPTNLPPRATVVSPPVAVASCQIPVGHVFTPPGTVCATCHNAVLVKTLATATTPCAQPQSSELPTLPVVSTLMRIVNDAGADVVPGAVSADATPDLRGTLSVALRAGQTLAVLRNGTAVGTAVVSGTTWSYIDTSAPQGLVRYTTRVVEGTGFSATSNAISITIDSIAPAAATAVTAITDDRFGAIANGDYATDTTPTISGTLSAALAANERVQVLRNSVVVGDAGSGVGNWTYTEPAALPAGTYSYQARVIDSAGNLGSSGAARSVVIVASVATGMITSAEDDSGTPITTGSITRDGTPTLRGSLSAALPSGQVLRVRNNGAPVGVATLAGTSWSYTDTAREGSVSYTVRVDAGAATFGDESAPWAFTTDTLAPTQAADVTQITDRFVGNLAPGAITADANPVISGTLSATLASGEQIRVMRQLGAATPVELSPRLTPAGTAWTYTETAAVAAGTYTYRAQVTDAAGNLGALGVARTVTIDPTALPLPGAAVLTITINAVDGASGAVPPNRVAAPTLAGTLQRSLNAGEVVKVYRDGAVQTGTATVTGQSWSYAPPTSATLISGTYTFYARVELAANASAYGLASTTVTVPIDTTAPAQTANVSAIVDNRAGSVAVGGGFSGDTTPVISGTLTAALGSGDQLRLARSGTSAATVVVTVTPGATAWTFTEPSALAAGAYTYSAQVFDTVGGGPAGGAQLGVTVVAEAGMPATTMNLARVSGTGSGGKPNTTVVATGRGMPDLSPSFEVQVASLPVGHVVELLRDGGTTAIASSSTCAVPAPCVVTLTDPGTSEGAHSYRARVVAGSAIGAQSVTAYTLDVDVTAPAAPQITAVVNNRPYNNLANPVSGEELAITRTSTTTDPDPRIRATFAALPTNHQVRVYSNGTATGVPAASTSTAGAQGLTIDHAATLARPASTPSSVGSAVVYTAVQEDDAGNRSTVSVGAGSSFDFNIAYLFCNQARALAGSSNSTHASGSFPAVGAGLLDCASSGCHATTATVGADAYIAAPRAAPLANSLGQSNWYWCKRL